MLELEPEPRRARASWGPESRTTRITLSRYRNGGGGSVLKEFLHQSMLMHIVPTFCLKKSPGRAVGRSPCPLTSWLVAFVIGVPISSVKNGCARGSATYRRLGLEDDTEFHAVQYGGASGSRRDRVARNAHVPEQGCRDRVRLWQLHPYATHMVCIH